MHKLGCAAARTSTCLQDEAERDTLREIISNSKLSEHFLALARDLDVMEPKVPEDVYKTHLTGGLRFIGFALCIRSNSGQLQLVKNSLQF
jgi:hypothetical protein